VTSICALFLSLGCASAKPAPSSAAEATATQTPAEAVAASTDAPANAAVEAPAPAASAEPKPADEPRDGLRKASRPPLELLTGNNVVYVFNYGESPVGIAAKERCEGENSGDLGAARQCIAKERSKVAVESVRFVKDGSGQYWWVTYNSYKGNLLKWHKIQFLPGKEGADSVKLMLTGKDKGIAPLARVPATLKIELPNDYSIVISDPEHGAMHYDAKIGLMQQDGE
jgi:hypothetical protein